jgi:uncharacterized membrane protein YukC
MFISFASIADEKKEEKFETVKSKTLENIDKRLTQLQSDKSCISAAKDPEGLKECRKKSREARKAQRDQWKQKKEQRKEQKSKN